MKNKKQKATKFKNYTKALLFLSVIFFIGYTVINPIPTTSATVPQCAYNRLPIAEDREVPMMEWVKNEIEKAGLNWDKVYCLIKHESNWNDYAYGFNTNKSSDLGLWQINSIHKKTISVRDRFDYKKATKWAINKRLRDGNWHAWCAYNKFCKHK